MGCNNSKEIPKNNKNKLKIKKSKNSFKIVLLGDIFVGKTSIISYIHKKDKKNNYSPTIGFAFYEKNIIINNQEINLQIWDTSGERSVRDLVSLYFRDAKVAILVFDLSNKNSFKNLDSWFDTLNEKNNSDFGLFLVGNKSDLEDAKDLKLEEIEKLQKKMKITNFIKTSAYTGENIERLFDLISNYCINN